MIWKGTALVTGASSGLGAEFARQLAERGCDLILTARREDRLRSLAQEIRAETGQSIEIITADLGTPEGVNQVLDSLEQRKVVPNYLVNNAGRGWFGAALESPIELVLSLIRLNVEAVAVLSHQIGRKMAQRGSGGILNVASTAAYQPVPYFALYSATKAFVLSFSEALSAELSARGVRVFTICPGPTESEFGEVAGFDRKMFGIVYTSASECVRRALNAYEDGRITHVDGLINTWGTMLPRLAPRALLTRWIATFTRR